jgi:hypothetical protein
MIEHAIREGYSLDAEKVTCPVLDIPLETAQLILGFTDGSTTRARPPARRTASRSAMR